MFTDQKARGAILRQSGPTLTQERFQAFIVSNIWPDHEELEELNEGAKDFLVPLGALAMPSDLVKLNRYTDSVAGKVDDLQFFLEERSVMTIRHSINESGPRILRNGVFALILGPPDPMYGAHKITLPPSLHDTVGGVIDQLEMLQLKGQMTPLDQKR